MDDDAGLRSFVCQDLIIVISSKSCLTSVSGGMVCSNGNELRQTCRSSLWVDGRFLEAAIFGSLPIKVTAS